VLAGFEALLRWNHPKLGSVPPSKFVPIAEEAGLIVPIGEWVLLEACRMGCAKQSAGPVRVDVNVSMVQFARPDFVATVAHVLERTGLNPALLELELTESVLMRDFEESVQKITSLQSLGVSIAIDDFGTGYSSLNYLQRLPTDALKIDRSFVQGIGSDASVPPLLEAMISLG
jgi:EAL domain-containing protein (putative c-di-GMP-specific phosphodiesterase class I)